MAIEQNWIQTASGSPTYSARMDRHLVDSLYDEGVLRGLKTAINGSTRSVDITVGRAVVQGDDQAGQNTYLVSLTAAANVAIPAAPGSGSTKHLVGFQVNDPAHGGAGTKDTTLTVVSGTAGAGTRPATPSSFLEIVEATMNAGSSLVSSISDTRIWSGPKAQVGTVMQWYGSSTRVPRGWAIMDGSVIGTVSAYPDLADLLGVPSGNVTLPDARDRVLLGIKAGGIAATLGATGGASTHALTTAELAAHNHGVTDPGHAHYVSPWNSGGTAGVGLTQVNGNLTQGTGSATTGITTQNAGSGTAHNNLQPYIALHHLIRVL